MSGFLAFHLGAGCHSQKNKSSYKKLCSFACDKLKTSLMDGSSALDLVAECTVILENSPLTNSGTGSNLTIDGKVECDASIMDGKSCTTGAVGAVSGLSNPILLAKYLAVEQTKLQPAGRVAPCILVGEGAFNYAKQNGIPTVDPSNLITARSKKTLRKCRRRLGIFNSTSVQLVLGRKDLMILDFEFLNGLIHFQKVKNDLYQIDTVEIHVLTLNYSFKHLYWCLQTVVQ